jgi:hypothetical protein
MVIFYCHTYYQAKAKAHPPPLPQNEIGRRKIQNLNLSYILAQPKNSLCLSIIYYYLVVIQEDFDALKPLVRFFFCTPFI